MRSDRRNQLIGLGFISPWIVGFLAFSAYPVLASLFYSFCDYDILSSPIWIGLLNYREMLADGVFWKALANTIRYALFALPLGMLLSLLVAVMLNQRIVGRPFFRTIYFLPSLVPMVASVMLWIWLFNGSFGLINFGLAKLGIRGPNWLTDEQWTMPSLVLMSLWGIGNAIVIYLAALQDVPASLYEAAELDGAGPWARLWHVTLPVISPVIYFNLIMGIIGSLQVFVQPFIMMPNGGPNRSALFYAVHLYDKAFSDLRMGYACAMAWLMFLLVVGLSLAATRLTRRHIHYAGE